MKTLRVFFLIGTLSTSALAVGEYHPDAAPSQGGRSNSAALSIGAGVAITGLVVWFFHHKKVKKARREPIRYHIKA